MTRAIIIREHGGPEVLKVEDLEVGPPGPGQIKVRNRAVGLNFIDVYQRTGLYKVPLPFIAGNEGAGEVMAVGPDVADFQPGDRIAYQGPVGAYADERLMPADKAVRLPDTIEFGTAAAALLKDRPNPTDAEIDAAMTNICRCGTYNRVRAAIKVVAGGGDAKRAGLDIQHVSASATSGTSGTSSSKEAV